jgi:hypothetical protein
MDGGRLAMGPLQNFADILDAVDNLSREEKETFLEVLHRRFIEQRREEIAAEIRATRQEFSAGECQAVNVDALMKEIVS